MIISNVFVWFSNFCPIILFVLYDDGYNIPEIMCYFQIKTEKWYNNRLKQSRIITQFLF